MIFKNTGSNAQIFYEMSGDEMENLYNLGPEYTGSVYISENNSVFIFSRVRECYPDGKKILTWRLIFAPCPCKVRKNGCSEPKVYKRVDEPTQYQEGDIWIKGSSVYRGAKFFDGTELVQRWVKMIDPSEC